MWEGVGEWQERTQDRGEVKEGGEKRRELGKTKFGTIEERKATGTCEVKENKEERKNLKAGMEKREGDTEVVLRGREEE